MEDIGTSLSWQVVSCMAFVFLVSPFFVKVILSFLRDQPPTKQCTVTYLYQDLIKVHLGFVWVWSLSGIILKILSDIGKDDLARHFVTCLVLVHQAVFLLIILYICMIGVLRMCSAKLNKLDPLEEMIGGNDVQTIKIVRLIIWSTVALVLILYMCTYTRPIVYYQILEQKQTLAELPTNSLILFFFDLGLCLFSILLHVMVKMYQNIDDAKVRRELQELDKHLNASFGNTKRNSVKETCDDTIQNPWTPPYSVNRSTVPLVLCIGNSILFVLLLLLRYFGIPYINFWWIMATFIANQAVILPLIFILFYQEVRLYLCRRSKYYVDAFVNRYKEIKSQIQRRKLRKVIPLNDRRMEEAN